MAKRSKKKTAPSGATSSKVKTLGARTHEPQALLNSDWFPGLILLLAVVLVYLPVWWAGYIWDDNLIVTGNPSIIGPFGLTEIWTTSQAQFFPLVLTTVWVIHAFWGLDPLPYHLVNVLMHATTAILLWRVLRSLRVPGAWLGAALWALHPLQVESVAWISELKNTQSAVFYLLTILFFVRWLREKDSGEKKRGWDYALTLLFAAMALASKPSTVILPAVLCLCAWWVEGRWQGRNLARVTPIFLMSIAASALTVWSAGIGNASADPLFARSWLERLATAGDEVWFYLGKSLWPYPLMTVYPRWTIDPGQWVSFLPLLAIIVIMVVLWVKRATWSRPYFFALAYLLVALLPVMGLVQHPYLNMSFVGDHFQYLAGMGPAALAGAGLAKLEEVVFPGKLWLATSLAAALLLILGVVSWQRAWVYEDQLTLWTDALAKNPNCWVGYENLGETFELKGQLDEAIAADQKALKIYPNYAEANNNLGLALFEKGQVDQAISHYQRALELNPSHPETYFDLGNALLQKGRSDEAIDQYKKALELDPNFVKAHCNLGVVLFKKGRVDEAILQFQQALQLQPGYTAAQDNLAKVEAMSGRSPNPK